MLGQRNADRFNARKGDTRAPQVAPDCLHTIGIGDHGLDLGSAVKLPEMLVALISLSGIVRRTDLRRAGRGLSVLP